jgi:hypothetical protein
MLAPDDYIRARNGLMAKDLLAFDGTRFQVLDLPEKPVPQHDLEEHALKVLEDNDPATIKMLIRESFDDCDRDRSR